MSFLEDRDWRVGQSINSLSPENNETSPCKDSLACTVYCSPTSIHRKIHWKPRHNDHQCQRQSHTNFGHGRPQRSAAVASLQAPQVALVCLGNDSLIPLGRLCLQHRMAEVDLRYLLMFHHKISLELSDLSDSRYPIYPHPATRWRCQATPVGK